MEKNFNLSSLSTVYNPIEEYLKSIKVGLQENLNIVKDAGKLATNFEYIETLLRVRSVFEMVGLNGLNRVILLVEDANKGIKEASFSTKETIAIFEESINIIKSIEVYIKQLLDGSLDQPTRFFDKYKKLAEIIDLEVDIKDLFKPKLEVKEAKLKNELKIGQYLNKSNDDEIKQMCEISVDKISTYIPVILEKISKFNSLNETTDMVEFKHACKVVYDALTDLQTLKLSKSYYVLTGIQKLMLCICAPFFNENFNALALSNLQGMKLNIALIEETAVRLNDGIQALQLGKKTSFVKIHEDVVTENLFFVVNAIIKNPKLKDMPVFKELDAYFAYDFYEEQLSSDTIQATITYQNSGLSEQLEEILFHIKEELVIVTGKKHNEDAYNQHLSKFYVLHYKFWEVLKVANGELNFKSFANSLVELTEKMKTKKVKITEELKKEISMSTVWTEYAINNLIKKRIEQKIRVDFEKQLEIQEKRIRNLSAGESLSGLPVPVLDAISKEQEARKAVLKIYEEVEKDLRIAEETLEGVLRTKSLEDKDLDLVLKPLNAIKGILLLLGNRDMGDLVKELIRIWKCVQQNGLDSIPQVDLEKSVVWFAGLSLFVSASRNNNEFKSKEIEVKLMQEFKGETVKVVQKAAELIIPEGVLEQDKVENEDRDVTETETEQVNVVDVTDDIVVALDEQINTDKEALSVNVENDDIVINIPSISVEEDVSVEINDLVEQNQMVAINEQEGKTSLEKVEPIMAKNQNDTLDTSEAEDDELKEIFVEEVVSLYETCVEAINALKSDPTLHVEAVTVRRVFHTYKGSGRMIGIDNLGEVAWAAEQELNKLVSAPEVNMTKNELMAIENLNTKVFMWSKELMTTGKVVLSIEKEKNQFLQEFNGNTINTINTIDEMRDLDELQVNDLNNAETIETVIVMEPESSQVESVEEEINLDDMLNNVNDNELRVVEQTYEEKQEEEKVEVINVVDEPTEQEQEIKILDDYESIDTVDDVVIPVIEEDDESENESETVVVILDENENVEHDEIVVPQIDDFEDDLPENEANNLLHDLENANEEIIQPVQEQELKFEDDALSGVTYTPAMEEVKELEDEELYNLCQLEIQENLEKLIKVSEKTLDNNKDQYEFMRFAHTLSSLGKTINLNNMAEVAHKIEIIGEVMIEKNKSLSQENLTSLREIIIQLQNKSTKENEPNDEELEDFFIALTKIKASLTESNVTEFELNNEVQRRLEEVYQKLEESKENKGDVEQIVSFNIPKEFADLPEKVEKLDRVVVNHDESIKLIEKSIESINEELTDLKEKTARIKRETIHRLKELKLEVTALKEPVKKKSNGSDIWVFQEIVFGEKLDLEEMVKELNNITSLLSLEEFNEEESQRVVSCIENLELSIEMAIFDLENYLTLTNDSEEVISITSIDQDNEIIISFDEKVESVEDIMEPKSFENEESIKAHLEEQLAQTEKVSEELREVKLGTIAKESMEAIEILSDPIVLEIFEEKISTIEDEYEEEMFDIAKEEIEEKKQQVEEILENTVEDILDKEVNAEIKRHLHTLKGSLRMAGLNKMGFIAHRLESLLDYAENRDLSLLKIKPILESEITKLKFLEKHLIEVPKDKISWLDNLAVTGVGAEKTSELNVGETEVKKEELKIVPPQNFVAPKVEEKQNSVKMSAKVLDSLFNDAGEMRLSRITIEGAINNHKKYLVDMRAASKKMSSLLRELEIQAETQIAAKKELEAELGDGFDPLEFDRYTRLQELTRFMNEALADVEDGLVDLAFIQKIQENTIIQQEIVTNNILNSIMHVRLIPVDSINEKLYRISRNTSKELGKLVVLDISGEKTEIDRFVLEKMFDPLAHILRNCIAHGIELPEKREKNGKNKVGKISLDIKQEGNFIIMTVSDDGAGINVNKIKEKAIEKGLIHTGQKLEEDEIIDLIYRSGFSTVDEVSQVAGRGVGMDVVKSEILSLGGNIKTTSVNGKGTVFKIVLPVSVATNQVLISTTMGKLIAIPAILVEQVVSIKESEMEGYYKNNKVTVNGEELELSYMGHLSGVLGFNQMPKLNPYNIVVVVSHGDERIAIHLDKLETTEEILIKPVGPYFSKIKGLLGATLLGDGRQGLVVNPVLLKEHYKEMLRKDNTSLISNVHNVIRVLVVDDANTVRRTTEKILKKNGFEVFLAIDGANALEILQEMKPDIILSDIEMPVMNGFELLKSLKVSDSLKNIPVIMITSRTADKHRQMAFDLGCDGFLGKPYLEDELIENINALTNHKK